MSNLVKCVAFVAISHGLIGCATNSQTEALPVAVEPSWSPTLILNRSSYERDQESLYEKQARSKEAYILPAQVLSQDEVAALLNDEKAFSVFMKNPEYLEGNQVAFIFKEGSLKDNTVRLAEVFGVDNVQWDLYYDYNLSETKTVVANTKEDLLSLLIEPFPVESKLYTKNGQKILSITRIGEIDKEYRFTVREGSFKDNFMRLSDKADWAGDWLFDYDFNIPETYIVRGRSYEDILSNLISKYNLPIDKFEEE